MGEGEAKGVQYSQRSITRLADLNVLRNRVEAERE